VSALQRAATEVPATDDATGDPGFDSPGDRRNRRLADALWALASQKIAGDCDADRATVVVHTALESLGDRGPFCELEGGGVLNKDTARRLSCDARLQFVLTDHDGNPLGIGRTSRNVPHWLMRQLRFRDHGCTFPGCGTRAFVQAHHIWHWEDGGPTDYDNLRLVFVASQAAARVLVGHAHRRRRRRRVVPARRVALRSGTGSAGAARRNQAGTYRTLDPPIEATHPRKYALLYSTP
jgi:hypothetical protein